MTRYIDASNLKEVFINIKEHLDAQEKPLMADLRASILATLDMINVQPAADVKEVIRGEWERDDIYQKCSRCFQVFQAENCPIEELLFNFCPNCGADMRKEAE